MTDHSVLAKRIRKLVRDLSIKQWVGVIGVVVFLGVYLHSPTWPTADKILVLFVFIFMAMNNVREGLLKFGPFVALLFVYESLRGWAAPADTSPTGPTHYDWPIAADKWITGGRLPTEILQDWFWSGAPSFFDKFIYGVYMLHFILPFSLALLVWKLRGSRAYWRYTSTILLVSFAGFITFWAMPVAPPWLAAEHQITGGFVRVSSEIWYSLGLVDFPTIYSKISPNSVAAVPSLHAAYATLLAIFSFKYFGKKWGFVSMIYPVLIYFGTVYMADHYLVDELIGSAYAVVGYFITGIVVTRLIPRLKLSK